MVMLTRHVDIPSGSKCEVKEELIGDINSENGYSIVGVFVGVYIDISFLKKFKFLCWMNEKSPQTLL
jgi:hypothetical protein